MSFKFVRLAFIEQRRSVSKLCTIMTSALYLEHYLDSKLLKISVLHALMVKSVREVGPFHYSKGSSTQILQTNKNIHIRVENKHPKISTNGFTNPECFIIKQLSISQFLTQVLKTYRLSFNGTLL